MKKRKGGLIILGALISLGVSGRIQDGAKR